MIVNDARPVNREIIFGLRSSYHTQAIDILVLIVQPFYKYTLMKIGHMMQYRDTEEIFLVSTCFSLAGRLFSKPKKISNIYVKRRKKKQKLGRNRQSETVGPCSKIKCFDEHLFLGSSHSLLKLMEFNKNLVANLASLFGVFQSICNEEELNISRDDWPEIE